MEWASSVGNELVAHLLLEGESSTVEFKEQIPEQADKIAKEVAAFATSGGGSIILGVNNQGITVGLGECSHVTRENIHDRITGIVSSMNPSPSGIEYYECYVNSQFVFLIKIPPQNEPVFYYRDAIYIRDNKCSRPTKPEEVKKQFLLWSKQQLMIDEDLRKKQIENQYEELRFQQIQNLQHESHLARMRIINC